MSVLLGVLKSVLGIADGASVINNAGGALSRLALIPAAGWFLAHADQQIKFETSLGFLGLACVVGWLVLEVLRRSRPGGP